MNDTLSEREVATPSDVAYENLTFSDTLNRIKDGRKMQRDGWNEKGMFIFLGVVEKFWIPTSIDQEEERRNEELEKFQQTPCLIMKAADGSLAFGWRPTTEDMFKSDWRVVEGGSNG